MPRTRFTRESDSAERGVGRLLTVADSNEALAIVLQLWSVCHCVRKSNSHNACFNLGFSNGDDVSDEIAALACSITVLDREGALLDDGIGVRITRSERAAGAATLLAADLCVRIWYPKVRASSIKLQTEWLWWCPNTQIQPIKLMERSAGHRKRERRDLHFVPQQA